MTEESEVGTLVQASAKGDEAAWNALVRRYAPLVLAVIRSYQLAAADVQDVSQTVWLRLVEHLADLRAPEALPGWLVTTTQRECAPLPAAGAEDPADRSAQRRHHEARHHRGPRPRHPAGRTPPGAARRAGGASAREQRLLRLRAADPPKSYQEISKLTGMPVGSIGPSLRRSLDRLRRTKAVQAYLATSPGASRIGGRSA